MRIEHCLSCGADDLRAVGKSGKTNPIEPNPVEGGNVRLVGRDDQKPLALYDRKGQQRDLGTPDREDDGVRYVSHFVNCPDAPQWRRS